jgi:predicted nucleotidyltransferase
MPWADSFLRQLEQYCGTEFSPIRAAYELSEKTLDDLSEIVREILPEEASFVAFGSLARKEFTNGSDLDWSLMIDGRADPGHRSLEQTIRRALKERFDDPNPAGAFGSMVFGHELVHCIGGNDDTNANLTRRQLLLLESVETKPHSELSPRSRVIRGVLERYFEEEAYFPGKTFFFPRFFLNDVVRYWRTIAVDYAAKNSERAGQGWALRNTKLRFSRKLLYIAGLLLTYETTLFPESDLIPTGERAHSRNQANEPQLSSIESCFMALQLTPLELLARACVKLEIPRDDTAAVFHAYGQFLDILNSDEKRTELNHLTFHAATTNRLFQSVRELSHDFQEKLSSFFMNPLNQIGYLTLKYGIF